MKKQIALTTLMVVLVTLAGFTPAVNAAAFTWDGLTFQEGITVAYPHPDRTVYSISPYSEWSMDGWKLHHHQFDRAQSLLIIRSAAALTTALGAYVGFKIGGPYGAVAGAVLGAVLGIIIYYVAESLFLDENSCIWYWLGSEFLAGLSAFSELIALYSIVNPPVARNIIFWLLDEYGYVRVGSVTFVDVVNPTWCRGDLNYDGEVDIFDMSILSRAYGSSEGDPNWNPVADVNEDGEVDVLDLSIVAHDYGKVAPVWPLPIE